MLRDWTVEVKSPGDEGLFPGGARGGAPAVRRVRAHSRRPLVRLAMVLGNFTAQFVERRPKLIQHIVTERREAIDARALRSRRLRCPQPAALCHARENRIERPRTEA